MPTIKNIEFKSNDEIVAFSIVFSINSNIEAKLKEKADVYISLLYFLNK